MNKMEEIVYAIKVSDLFSNNDHFNEYKTPADPVILNRIYTKNVEMPRGECEENPEFKHIIPYCILTSTDNRIFVVRRTTNQTEKRLHDKASIGIGGHVGPTRFATPKNAIYMGMLRELKEEITGMSYLGKELDFTPKLSGFVNASDPVGLVHFGLVYELVVDPERVKTITVKETENMYGKWMSFKEASLLDNYESWSYYIMEDILRRVKNGKG